LIKSGTALERLAEVDTVVFDKTGTLTMGLPVLSARDSLAREDLSVAMALSENSSHPLARGIAHAGRSLGVTPATVTDLTEVPGLGIEGRWQGLRVRLGRAEWLGAESGDSTATWLGIEGRTPVRYDFTDRLRPGAA